ncbi:flagellar biosynthesis chaperone FliJ [Bacillus sp. V3B]|uniref:flagellar export protein FliJ n=1 Tax=Bacillus sp. V3B TaxID=2804915 RepID=UPI00210A4849|nr:flagellar export protein FliJ [Bacillus sp. V3B]MCQ6274095.1 flagellar biosynthesis chaperone FliJ [Bacillus sp. V3B]
MPYHFKFEKIMMLKEREKDEALSVYNDSVKRFEEAAEKLYEALKKKEDLESYQSTKLENGLPVQEIRHHQRFILNLQKTIDHYQQMVHNSRTHMHFYQEKLMEKNIEVKKYEKMQEKGKLEFFEGLKQIEARQMDDISIQYYVHRGS